MAQCRYAWLLALSSALLLGACTDLGRNEVSDPRAAAVSRDVPGATRAELARVPKQFPLPSAPPEAFDAAVGEDDGKQTVTLRFAAAGWPAENALLLSDHLAALGWRVVVPARSASDSSFRFEGFGWSGQAAFKAGKERTADAVIEFKQASR